MALFSSFKLKLEECWNALWEGFESEQKEWEIQFPLAHRKGEADLTQSPTYPELSWRILREQATKWDHMTKDKHLIYYILVVYCVHNIQCFFSFSRALSLRLASGLHTTGCVCGFCHCWVQQCSLHSSCKRKSNHQAQMKFCCPLHYVWPSG